MKCLCCPNEFHPDSGGLHPYPHPDGTEHIVAFCGACERDFLDWLWRHTRARMRRTTAADGKTVVLRFYDHAAPPPPAAPGDQPSAPPGPPETPSE